MPTQTGYNRAERPPPGEEGYTEDVMVFGELVVLAATASVSFPGAGMTTSRPHLLASAAVVQLHHARAQSRVEDAGAALAGSSGTALDNLDGQMYRSVRVDSASRPWLQGGSDSSPPVPRVKREADNEGAAALDSPLATSSGCDPQWVEVPLPDETPFVTSIERAARRADLHPRLLAALVQAESGFDPSAVSSAGACGLTQLMPAVSFEQRVEDVFDPDENLRGGAGHLRPLLDRFSSLPLALAAYNAGAPAVVSARGVPRNRETHGFVRRVMAIFCPSNDRVTIASLTPPTAPSPDTEF
jgi:hypothetical protein